MLFLQQCDPFNVAKSDYSAFVMQTDKNLPGVCQLGFVWQIVGMLNVHNSVLLLCNQVNK